MQTLLPKHPAEGRLRQEVSHSKGCPSIKEPAWNQSFMEPHGEKKWFSFILPKGRLRLNSNGTKTQQNIGTRCYWSARLSTEPRKLIFKVSEERRLRNNIIMFFSIFERVMLLSHGNNDKLYFPRVTEFLLPLRERKFGKIGFILLEQLSLPISQTRKGRIFRK